MMELDDVLHDVMDAGRDAERLREYLRDAESCETRNDLHANLADAEEAARELLAAVKAARRQLAKVQSSR